MLKVAPVKLVVLSALSFSIIACGQSNSPTPVSTSSPSINAKVASPSLPQNSSTAAQEPQTASAPTQRSLNAEAIYAEFGRLVNRACQKQEKVVGDTRYTLCTANDRIVSASSSLASGGDGAEYWLNEQGDIYVIRYFHSGEVLVLMPDDKKTVVELIGESGIKPTTDEARWNQLELGARDQIITISEQFDLADPGASTPETSDNSDRQDIERIARPYLNPEALAGAGLPRTTIQKMAIVDGTALLSWQRGEAGGMMLLKKDGNSWRVIESGGGAMNLMTLSEAGITRQTAEALLNQIDPNWNKY